MEKKPPFMNSSSTRPSVRTTHRMSDLALPFLLLLEDDEVAFWCFERCGRSGQAISVGPSPPPPTCRCLRLMRKVRSHFVVSDPTGGVFGQLARLSGLIEALEPALHSKLRDIGAADCRFAYRMIVVLMRREMPLEQVRGGGRGH